MSETEMPGEAGGGDSAWGRRAVAVIAVAVTGAAVYGIALLLGVLANPRPLMRAVASVSGGERVYTLNLSTWPDSLQGVHGKGGGAHPDWVTYGPTTDLWVPAHALVKVTVRNYDTSARPNDLFYARVQGTVGGVAYYNGKPLSQLPPDQSAHTFTIHMFPTSGQPMLDVSVPMLAVPDNAPTLANGYPKPTVTTFEFRTGGPGRYIWQCFAPCGDPTYAGFGGPMSTLGYMAGTITVGGAHA
jgi:hypothetical protein